ncbi:MAG TPA: imidazole glycerol phosphate synthase cyclase subunit [Bacillota bacterium]|nr:imidazole glycerol phosphate synthase cyclase subunit [Bacillota bacterium]
MTKRIVPCLDIINNRVVVGEQFKNLQDVEDPLSLARYYEQNEADDLIVYDISGKSDSKKQFLQLIKQISDIVSMPLTVGGGLKTIKDIKQMLTAGADRVSINSSAIHNEQFLKDAINTFGGKHIVLAIDAKEISPGKWHAFTNGGTKDSGLDIFLWAKRAEKMGVCEIVLNSIDYDGAKSGFAVELNKKMANSVNIPVIASGGAGNVKHFSEVFQKTAVSGALAASILHQQQVTIRDVKQHLLEKNIY